MFTQSFGRLTLRRTSGAVSLGARRLFRLSESARRERVLPAGLQSGSPGPPGRVVAYATIALLLEGPRVAREVGRAMRHYPQDLPWQRGDARRQRLRQAKRAPAPRAAQARRRAFPPRRPRGRSRVRHRPLPPGARRPSQGGSFYPRRLTRRLALWVVAVLVGRDSQVALEDLAKVGDVVVAVGVCDLLYGHAPVLREHALGAV